MSLLAMPRPKRALSRTWGETKRNRVQVLLTDTANDCLELSMERSRYSRSELIERLIRGEAEVQQVIAQALADVKAARAQSDEE